MIRNIIRAAIAAALLVCSSRSAQASIVHQSHVTGKYFKMEDGRGSRPDDIARSWRYWLQVHRAIKGNPKLAAKFKRPIDLTALLMEPDKEKLKKLGMKPTQIEFQPDYVYAVRLASHENPRSVADFVERHWLRKQMKKRKVYETVPKDLRLDVGGEVTARSDPLYSVHAAVQGRKVARVCYGVYESVADAERDRRVLARHLGAGVKPTLMRFHVTGELVERVWFAPIVGQSLRKWETTR